jgi:glycosyltransferase involved in cell wall biosynthesis
MACFVHSPALRRTANLLFRILRFDGLGFITFSRSERDNLIQGVGVPESLVLFHVWRQEHEGRPQPDEVVDGNYVFAGGYSNRDYDTLLRAAKRGDWRLMLVASSLNAIDSSICPRTEIFRDLPETDFERKLAGSRLVVMPLQSVGEACGQSVLLRVLRNSKPLITSRHESIVDYLGEDYPGFVAPGDVDALSSSIERALSDASFRALLTAAVQSATERLAARGTPGEEILAFLAL